MNLEGFLQENAVVYVARDMERALGFTSSNQPHVSPTGYHIISNDSPLSSMHSNNALLIKEMEELDTHMLLKHPQVLNYMSNLKNPHILVFKNTPQIERICTFKGWDLLNPSAELAKKVEEKISQVEWLDELTKYLPPYEITLCKNLEWDGEPYIVQFNHGHTGEGTLFINNAQIVEELRQKFPDRLARKTVFINGPVFTNNNIVTKNRILVGNINYQITGFSPFTEMPFSTVGNDWGLPSKLLNKKAQEKYVEIVEAVGRKLRNDGWKGLFGIDIKIDAKSGELYLLEINARQPASTTYESWLQKLSDPKGLSTFEAHLMALLDMDVEGELTKITTGSQIVQRKTRDFMEGNKNLDREIIDRLTAKSLRVISYNNKRSNSDLLRIQSTESIMKSAYDFNELGQYIKEVLS